MRIVASAQRDERVKMLDSIRPVRAEDIVRGQDHGYPRGRWVAPDSTAETSVAFPLDVPTRRWSGVQYSVRSGSTRDDPNGG